MKKFPKFKLKKRYIVLGLLVVFVVFSIINGKKKKDDAKEFFTIETGSISESIVFAGDVDMKNRVDLGFGISGRVSKIFFNEGDTVKKGDVIAGISMGELQAQLLEAQANLSQTKADNSVTVVDLSYAYQNLQNTTQEQNTLVENAYRTLLNQSLEVYSEKNNTSATPPTISGTYTGNEEGDYIVSIYNSSSVSGYSFNLSGLENDFGPVKTNVSSALGTHGLYIQFTDGDNYGKTDWVVSIPNKRSANYIIKKNAYDQALVTRISTISQAEDTYLQAQALESQGVMLSKSQASIQASQARIEAVRAKMLDGLVIAPFNGIVGRLNLNVGEIVSANTSYVTLVGSESFELSLDVPEIDVAKLEVGNDVVITLDAYGEEAVWSGIISTIDVIDTLVDGIPVYKTTVTLANADPRVRVGMSAKAKIITAEKESVLIAPQYFFEQTGAGYKVMVKRGEKEEIQIVTLGLEGSDGNVEILTGLSSGDVLVRIKKTQ